MWKEISNDLRSKYFWGVIFKTSLNFRKPLDHDDFPYDHHVWVYIGQKDPDRHEEFKAYILEEPRKSPLPGQYQEPEYDEYVLELKWFDQKQEADFVICK